MNSWSAEQWHKFYEDSRVVELTKQLHDGLIHPVEYAHAILDYAARLGYSNA